MGRGHKAVERWPEEQKKRRGNWVAAAYMIRRCRREAKGGKELTALSQMINRKGAGRPGGSASNGGRDSA